MKENARKKLIIMIVSLLIALVGIGITFAFFNPFLNKEGDITVDVTASDLV